MRRRILTILLLVAGMAYMGPVLELDSNECKQNYKNENHSQVTSIEASVNLAFHVEKHIDLFPALFNPDVSTGKPLRTVFRTSNSLHDPPLKLYLRNSVFLI